MKVRNQLHYVRNRAAYITRAALRPAEETRIYKTRWKAANPSRVAVHRRRRKANMNLATPAWLSPEQWAEMDAVYREARRLTEAGDPHDVDHIIPLQGRYVCGLHVPWNLRVLSRDDNNCRPRIYRG